jgi:hypothetical protein
MSGAERSVQPQFSHSDFLTVGVGRKPDLRAGTIEVRNAAQGSIARRSASARGRPEADVRSGVVERGIGLQDQQMKEALANIEKMEDMFFKAIGSAARSADDAMRGPWEKALASMQVEGTATGAQAVTSLEQLTALRDRLARRSQCQRAQCAGVVEGLCRAGQRRPDRND